MGKRIYLVPGRGRRMRTTRVPVWLVVAVVFMAAVGIAGYFVPLDRFMMTEHELAQKQSLMEQNERLHNNIGTTLRMLSGLRERTERLLIKKERYREIIALPGEPTPTPVRPQQKGSTLSSAAMVRHIDASEQLVRKFTSSLPQGKHTFFDTVPVIRPVDPALSVLSKRFGMGRDPFTGSQKMHYGTDFAAETGVPVVATATGVVTLVENDPVWGRRIVITHGRGFRTVYAHLGTVKAVQGRTVRRGDEIGTVGMSGLTTGPHVHYEIWLRDRQLNPEEFFFPEQAAVALAD